jgi:DNA-binding winged helix-turn-helix (wHTH) protein
MPGDFIFREAAMARTQPGVLAYQGLDGLEQQLRLRQDVTTLGRSDTCDVVIVLPTVSRLHARIELDHDRYLLFDAGSANGTFLNGRRIDHSYELHTGDTFWLGSTTASITFSDPDETLLIPVSAAPLSFDEQAHMVTLHGVPMQLSPLEYRLLVYLASNPGTVCTRESCFLAAWSQPYDQATCEDALNNCVSKLRRNLRATADQAGAEPPPIITIPRVGFRLDSEVAFVATPDLLPHDRERAVGEML